MRSLMEYEEAFTSPAYPEGASRVRNYIRA